MASMDPAGALLTLLGDIYISGRSGRLHLAREGEPERLGLSFQKGRLVRAETVAEGPAPLPRPDPGDELGRHLARVLSELGIARQGTGNGGARLCPRGTVLEAFAWNGAAFDFGESEVAADADGDPGISTEELVLEAVRRLPDPGAVRAALGDGKRPLGLALNPDFNRELTPTDAYILSRVDGRMSAEEVLELVPQDPTEAERSLLGLLLTGVVELLEAPPPRPAPSPAAAPAPETSHPLPPAAAQAPVDEAAMKRLEPQRREILATWEALAQLSHFEVLGVSELASEHELKQAYFQKAKKYHPDQYLDPGFADLADKIEEVFMRVGGAYEVLRDPESRTSYESVLRRRRARENPQPARATSSPAGAAGAEEPARLEEDQIIDNAENAWMAEEAIRRADGLIGVGKVWDAIQLLTAIIPRIYGRKQRERARIYLAKAYIKNPNWLRRGEELLQQVIQEDPQNAEAHFALGVLYKETGMSSRAVNLFKKALEIRPEHKLAQAELNALSGSALFRKLKLFGKG